MISAIAAAATAGKNAGKVYFVSQTGVAPPTFVCMCNDPKAFPKNYRRFFERKLRESMPFTGTPVRFVFRARRQREAERDGRKRSRALLCVHPSSRSVYFG